MNLRSIFSIIAVVGLSLNLNLAKAGEIEDNIKEFCHPIIKEQCATGVCEGVDKPTLNNAIYHSCVLEQTDMVLLRDTTALIDTLEPKSNTGFLMLFGKFTLWVMEDKNIKSERDFEKAKKEFVNIKAKYNAFLDKENVVIDTYIPTNASEVKAEKIQQGRTKEKIVQANSRLNFMLKTQESLAQYKAASQKFLPVIVIKEMSTPFKDQIFSNYECNFLDINFSKKVIIELKQELNYSCKNN